MKLPTEEEISKNYSFWYQYNKDLKKLLEECLPLQNKRRYTGILENLFNSHIKPIAPEENFYPSFVSGFSSGEGKF